MPDRPENTVEVRFRLRLGGAPWDAQAVVPRGPASAVDLLSIARELTDRVVAAAVDEVEQPVSCRAGCGACCRQPVPIADGEARALAALIAAMPEDRRRTVERRFSRGLEQLDAAGILDDLRRLADIDGLDARQSLGRAYFDLAIPCPFLEDEACSIHPDRPLSCREYLVTSAPEHCGDPGPDDVEMVPMPVRPSIALFKLAAGGMEAESRPLPLILARERAASPPERPTLSGPDLLESLVRGLASG